jgi:tetrapyrrole methylase family protein/MazG family protein
MRFQLRWLRFFNGREQVVNQSDPTIVQEIASLRRTLRMLRGPNGCPWDREQDLGDLISYLIEEAYELLQAEKLKDWREVEEELGDVFFILIFIHELLLEKRRTSLPRIVAKVHKKIVNRHPHVFGTAKARTSTESLAVWDRIKKAEKRTRTASGILEEVPTKLPPLRRAAAVQRKAAEIGFDWPDHTGILDKLHEEIGELTSELRSRKRERVKDEIGDIFFTVVNLARHLNVDPESVLESTTAKFMRRFAAVEREAKRTRRDLRTLSLDEMEKLWQKSKRKSPKRGKRRRL